MKVMAKSLVQASVKSVVKINNIKTNNIGLNKNLAANSFTKIFNTMSANQKKIDRVIGVTLTQKSLSPQKLLRLQYQVNNLFFRKQFFSELVRAPVSAIKQTSNMQV